MDAPVVAISVGGNVDDAAVQPSTKLGDYLSYRRDIFRRKKRHSVNQKAPLVSNEIQGIDASAQSKCSETHHLAVIFNPFATLGRAGEDQKRCGVCLTPLPSRRDFAPWRYEPSWCAHHRFQSTQS